MFRGLLSWCVFLLLLAAPARPQSCTGADILVFDNWNTGAVQNGGTPPEVDLGNEQVCLTRIATYHWNNSAGSRPGLIGLIDSAGVTAGVWQAVGSNGQNNAPDVNWDVRLTQTVLVRGKYTVFDSDRSTWSQNTASGGKGFAKVWVRKVVSGQPPTVPPTGFQIRLTTFPAAMVGVGYNWPVQADGATGEVQWTVSGLPPGVRFSPSGPAIMIVTGVPTQAGTFNLVVKATDPSGATDTRTFPITIAGTATGDRPRINKPELKPATINQEFRDSFTAEGGAPPYTWTMLSGFLPPGIDLEPDGLVHGVTGQRGQFTFVVQATDRNGQKSDPKEYSIFVFQQVTISRGFPVEGTVGIPVDTVMQAFGGTAPYRWTCKDLPPGLACDAVTGKVSGVPSRAGTYSVKVTATDSLGLASQEEIYPVKIADSTFRITSAALKPGRLGTAYNDKILTSGGSDRTQIKLIGGQLPRGLTLAADGTVSGTPAEAGSVKIRVQAEDPVSGRSVQGDLTIPIASGIPLSFQTDSPLLTGNVGQQYGPVTLETMGGCPPPRSFATVAASPFNPTVTIFPQGLTLNRDTGVISGIPTEVAERDVIVEVADDCGAARKVFHIRIDPPGLSVSFDGPVERQVILAYDRDSVVTIQPKVSGGTPPYTYSLPDVRPLDVTVDDLNRDTGKVTFRFAGTGDFRYRYMVRDKNGISIATTLTFHVVPAPFRLTNVTSPASGQGSEHLASVRRISFDIEGAPAGADGGDTPEYTFSIEGASLQDIFISGLAVDSKTTYTATRESIEGSPAGRLEVPHVKLTSGNHKLSFAAIFNSAREMSDLKLTMRADTGPGAGQSEVKIVAVPATESQKGSELRFNPVEPPRDLNGHIIDPELPESGFKIPIILKAIELLPEQFDAFDKLEEKFDAQPPVSKTSVGAQVGGLPPGASIYVPVQDNSSGFKIPDGQGDPVKVGDTEYRKAKIEGGKAKLTWQILNSGAATLDSYRFPFYIILPGLAPGSFQPLTLSAGLEPIDCLENTRFTNWPCYRPDDNPLALDFADPMNTISNLGERSLGSSIAPGGAALFNGNNLTIFSGLIGEGELPKDVLADRRISLIDAKGNEYPCKLISVGPFQIEFVLPDGVPAGDVTVNLLDSNTNSLVNVGRARVSAVAPGMLYTEGASPKIEDSSRYYATGTVAYGQERAVRVQLINIDKDAHVVPTAIDVGEQSVPPEITLLATGIRNSKRENIQIKVDGKQLPVTYSGKSREVPAGDLGRDEIQFTLPKEFRGKGLVNVEVSVDGKPANIVTLLVK